MQRSHLLRDELRALVPGWALTAILPLPMVNFWKDGPGRDFAYAYLFIGCALMIADGFCRPSPIGVAATREEEWNAKMAALSLAVAVAAAFFAVVGMGIVGGPSVGVLLGVLGVGLVVLGCIPYFTLLTGSRFLPLVLAVVLLGSIKLAGCGVARLVYGPNAQELGYMSFPWEHPNLLLWICIAGSLVSSAVIHRLGRRRFLQGAVLPKDGARMQLAS